MGKVNFKFRIGQTLYWKEMYSVPFIDKCKMCDGSGKIINKVNDESIICPKCNGNGEIDSKQGSIKERIVSGVVEKINIEITKEEGEKSYEIETTYSFDTNDDDCLTKYEYELYDKESDLKIGNLCAGYTS
jgi:DnaJ-class molecular chaperone